MQYFDIVEIGPECFTTEAEFVISYKGNNYYKACGVPVHSQNGNTSHCVKPEGHPRDEHEDYYGRTVIVSTPEECSTETP